MSTVATVCFGVMGLAVTGMCVSGCFMYPTWWTAYVLTFVVLIYVCFSINETAGLTIWKWRSNPKLAETSAMARTTGEAFGKLAQIVGKTIKS
jgi:hypothetical protein